MDKYPIKTDKPFHSHLANIGAGVLLGGALWALGTHGFAWLSTHPVRMPVWMPKDGDLPLEEVSFPARDGLRIAAWFAAAPNAWGGVILCHGHPANRMEMLPVARMLYPLGLNMLMFDFRALGQSEGRLCSIGYHEVDDLLGAADYMEKRPEMQGLSIGVYGLSMGGAVSLMAAAQDERMAAVATHGAYADLERAIIQRGRLLLGPAWRLLSEPTMFWGKQWVATEPRCVSPLDVISKIAPRPLLIVHGARDKIVSPEDAHALYAAAGDPKELLFLPMSRHQRINLHEKALYERTVCAFFQRYLRAR